MSLDDMIFSAAFKVYSTVSARRFMCDLRDASAKGYISPVPAYNTIFKYFESDLLTPHLQMLIEESALPLQVVESAFAAFGHPNREGARRYADGIIRRLDYLITNIGWLRN